MAMNFDELNNTPTLTLEPFAQDEVEIVSDVKNEVVAAQQEQAPQAQQQIPDVQLTPEEQQQVDQLAAQIDLSNTTMILQYGAGTQKKMADFSDTALQNVRSQDLGEIGELLTGVVQELKGFDTEDAKGIRGLFKKAANKKEMMKAQYAKAEANVNEVCKALEGHEIQLMKDAALLDKMYDLNLAYYKELSMYIMAGKQKLAETRNVQLPALLEQAQKSGLAQDAQAAKDLVAMCDRFEKKLYDLDLSRTISIQTGPQIRLVQSNDTQMAEKIQSTIVNTIPLWKSQMTIALGMQHSMQAAEAQRQVTDMTNELLRKNSQMLKTATVETAKETERGIVDMETLKETNANLISTLDEVLNIQKEGRQKRADAERELQEMEDELKKKLLEM